MSEVSFIQTIMKSAGMIEKYVNPVKECSKTLCFTSKEMVEFFGDDFNYELFIADFILADCEYLLNIKSRTSRTNYTISHASTDARRDLDALSKMNDSNVVLEFKQRILCDSLDDISNLCNKLEWFSMNFITKAADENVVYQSLHQTFLSCVEHLYIPISFRNTLSHDKYFTNIIELYARWNERLKEDIRKCENEKDALINSQDANTRPKSQIIK